ncbi:glutathione S-transferase family protein [Tabrizicola oligotrophica]|uniref:Glutathione S-transferase family protein n=1 Tax=Tabrizicola oligotrophica TaxID=2710650 RepID=A0A6M0QTL3_9RHOB|nr:glutathione S-transferase family protein [Tabrizicola oligotrophica]NEY89993.1 glutathione S-transferase family protein [Tabrizicola oligotrophica]
MLTFYTNPMSRGRMVRWMLEEIGRPYQTVVLAFGAMMKAPTYLAVNPMGKVPALVHDDQIITEAAAICTYLAEVFPDSGLLPVRRGEFFRWMFFGAGPLEQAVVNGSMGWEPAPEMKGRVGYGSMADVLSTLSGHLGANRYFCGDRFSAADVYVGSQIGWGLGFDTLPATPELVAYWDRIKGRPALVRANALDDALMKRGA